jgi:hypothetical protein
MDRIVIIVPSDHAKSSVKRERIVSSALHEHFLRATAFYFIAISQI